MSIIAQPVEKIGSFFDAPRKAYMEFLRSGILKDTETVLQQTREFKRRHGLTLLCGNHLRNVLEVEQDFLYAEQRARAARSVADVRMARMYLESIQRVNAEELLSLEVAMEIWGPRNVN